MKLKISWPLGIVVSLVAFIIFILSFVYKAMFLPNYDHHLVSENYYEDELLYQQEIDKENRGLGLEENISLTKNENGLLIKFPTEFEAEAISGTVYFQRLSNNKIDFKKEIQLNSHEMLIPKEQLVQGRWDIKIEWKAFEVDYLYKEKIIY